MQRVGCSEEAQAIDSLRPSLSSERCRDELSGGVLAGHGRDGLCMGPTAVQGVES